MYKAVVVCDSKSITDAFDSIDLWNDSDFSLVEVVKDINEIQTDKFDLLIGPVKIILQNNAALSQLNNNGYVARIFYGRKSFEHIKCAIDNGACGYIPVPIDKNDFNVAILNAHSNLSLLKNPNTVNMDIYEIRDAFVLNLLSGNIKVADELISEYSKLNFDIDITNVECAIIKITIENFNEYLRDVWKYGKDTLYNAVNNFIKKNDKDICILPFNIENNDVYVFCIKRRGASSDKYLYSVRNEIFELMGISLSYSILKNFNSILDIIDKTNIDILAHETGLVHGDDIDNTDKYKTISDAKKYITTAFSQEICLDDVAEYVSLSSAYFSRLFKQETGENFIDYLIKIRMENAKRMLETTSYKTYEISELVGYKKSKYFSKLFKNYTGYTPTEYRTKIKRKFKGE
ncbi:MAG: helix-turn-helix transcriptional regulator [Clostridia bacterium]|nr:helix-turn-helix transcriptional regulator [Clostridia bacterium]